MKILSIVVKVLVLFAVVSCGPKAPNVGGACTADAGCDKELSCSTAVPNGYCTQTCTNSGSTTQCPAEAVCDTVAGASLTCVKICKGVEDCRSDLDCNGVSGTNIKACKPKIK